MSKNLLFSLIHFLFFLPSFAFQDKNDTISLQLTSLFSDHMVLQQKSNVKFWGTDKPNNEITISTSWENESKTIVDINGHWNVSIGTPSAGGPFKIEIKSNQHKIVLNDIMIGEVWLASGQSNMEMTLMGWPPNDIINNADEEIAKSSNSKIRMFNVEKQISINPLGDVKGSWKVSSPEETKNFSASAYFFAKELFKKLQVPIGIINSSWGGTPAESWTSKKTIDTFNEFKSVTQSINTSDLFKNELKWFSQFKAIGIPTTDEQWINLNLLDNLIVEKSYNDSDWEEIQLPGRYDNQINGGEFNGAVWFRKNIVIDNLDSDYILTIGAVDDMDETYVNGHKIGGLIGMGFWNKKREFKIPKSILKKGNNTIAVRAIDAEGVGEIIGPMTLSNNNIKVSLNGNWKYKLIAEIYNNKFYLYGINNIDFNSRIKTIKLNSGVPTVLYNGMINPLVPYTIKGVIWYQGESNVGRADQYENLFPAMIRDWREKWNYDFPFYYVQIAPYQYNINKDSLLDQSQELREAQRNSLKTKNTGMVVTMDIGNFNNIHPSNKQDIGSRLARLALSNNYSINIVPSGPIFNGLKVIGSKLILEFENPGSRLISKGDLLGFEIAGADKKYVFANAKIINNQVELYSDKIKNPLYARYAWKDKAVPSLFNLEGLPASSFKYEE
ncbi:sialate O-acetylesterase [Flavobacteriaceae bacterium]|nr:sialate O-acetylesterase [Flavobacteriaceae bacterium]MDC1448988.1 sialate O-acetylesterase [Flavobacteriaceae bacterium]